MTKTYNCAESTELLAGTRAARAAIRRGELVVLPTDTVYGIAADAFNAQAVSRLLEAKGRTRQSPPPVLVAGREMASALADSLGPNALALIDAFWPGALTLVVNAQPSLHWDLGETHGTVAVRMPNHELALEILRETGPLAVSSANLTGHPAPNSADEAQRMLSDSVSVYLDAGVSSEASLASTIIDLRDVDSTEPAIRVLRLGPITPNDLQAILPAVTIHVD